MNCTEFEVAWVGDDEPERAAAEAHAAECPRCAKIVREDRELLEQAAGWKRSTATPPAGLEQRIEKSLATEGRVEAKVTTLRRPARVRRPVWLWAAAAAVLIIGIAVVAPPFLFEPGESSYEEIIAQAERAQDNYARAIADLERQAENVLARSDDPALSSRDAALLLSYRDRLTHLDSVIAEVQAFLDENPGHKNGHTVLLAAYHEKDELLREIIERSPGETS